jgi:hypothetical protein
MYVNVLWILFFSLAYAVIIMCLRKLAKLPASRDFVGLSFTLLAIGYELSLFFNWFRNDRVFPRPKVFLSFFKILEEYVFITNYDIKFLALIGVISIFCLLVTLNSYRDLRDDEFVKEKSDVQLERIRNISFGIGAFLFVLIFFLFWDVTY